VRVLICSRCNKEWIGLTTEICRRCGGRPLASTITLTDRAAKAVEELEAGLPFDRVLDRLLGRV